MELQDMFLEGEYFPPIEHQDRIERYRRNEKLAKGDHHEIFSSTHKNDLYISANFAGLIVRKSADFLLGEKPIISSGKKDGSNEQKMLDRLASTNNFHRLMYQVALQAASKGEGFVKVRYGQEYGGAFPDSYDPKRIIFEAVNPNKVFPQTSPLDKNKVIAYHIAEPISVEGDKYHLYVESHYAGRIVYRRFTLVEFLTLRNGEIVQFKIDQELAEYFEVVDTGVPVPLVVQVMNFNDGISWEGQDDISEHIALFDEINNRMTQIGNILDKHADPPLAVPTGLLNVDDEGQPYFNIAINKVFEVLGKEDIIPQYITNTNPLINDAMKELEYTIDYLLTTAEIPHMAVGLKDAGTSGNSGIAIKWRMNTLLAKINRKRHFMEDAMKRILMIGQLLEMSVKRVDYELTEPVIKFNDGLPQDETELANRMSIRTNGSQTLSRKTALMILDGLTEEQADEEIKRIDEENESQKLADPSIFNENINFEEDEELPEDETEVEEDAENEE